jgi:hypothetical protein
MTLRTEHDQTDTRRATAAARVLDLKPVTHGEMAVTLQVIEAILERRGEIRIVRVGTATVCVAGTEIRENEVGGDGPNVVEAVVACACDLVRFDERKSQRPVVEPDADDSEDASLFGW